MAKTHKYLLDTHILLWWLNDDYRLPHKVKDIIGHSDNIIMISVASVWEMCIKQGIGKLKLPVKVENIVEVSYFLLLSIELSHIAELDGLPLHHKDPFDRMLIAQSTVEQLTIISNNRHFKQYKIPVIYG